MAIVTAVFIFLLGTAIGSFLSVVILRYDTDQSLGGRSACPSCHATLTWMELVPLVSFFVLRGKCKHCSTSISWQYPIVELLTGLLFLATHMHFMYLFFSSAYLATVVFYLLVICLLVVITVYDWYHKIIPDPFVYILIVLGGVALFFHPDTLSFSLPSILEILAGPILFLPFAFLWLISKGAWMGFGDAKLAWAMGWLLGLRIGFSAVMVSFWIGALYALIAIFVQRSGILSRGLKLFAVPHKQLTMKSEIPFGPFMVLATLIGIFFSLDIFMLIG